MKKMWTKLKQLFTIKGKEPEVVEEPVMTVWNIIDGPLEIDGIMVILVNAEVAGEMEPVEMQFDNFDDAYDLVKYFAAHIYPLKFPLDGGKAYV
jgi:hypothetical protein